MIVFGINFDILLTSEMLNEVSKLTIQINKL